MVSAVTSKYRQFVAAHRAKLSTVRFLDSILTRDANNFDLVRLISALAVLFGHAFALFPHDVADNPFAQVATFGVAAFFLLSGILVSKSIDESRSIVDYGVARIARVYPALIVCVLIAAFIIGPIVTTLPLPQYLSNPATYGYAVDWAFMKFNFVLPGVFASNVYQSSVNGSLWTIPFEMNCYIAVAICFVFGVYRSRVRLAIALLIVALILLQQNIVGALPLYQMKVYLSFIAGVLLFVFRRHVPINTVAGVLIAVIAIASGFYENEIVLSLVLAYLVLAIAAEPGLRRLNPPYDASYGIYLYAFLVQQTCAYFWPQLRSYQSLALTIPLVLVLGTLSWFLIERPCIGWARRKRQAIKWAQAGARADVPTNARNSS